MKRASLKWFTLIEMLIVMVIIGILAVVLCESYITISETSLRVEQKKNLNEESLILTQILQAVSDEAQIDYDRYVWSLSWTNGYTWTLYLTGDNRSWTTITITWNCLPLTWFAMNDDWSYYHVNMEDYSWCNLILEQNWNITNLTSSKKIIPSDIQFRIIPYDSDNNYFSNESENVINEIHQQWFWLFIRLYSPIYQPWWRNEIDEPLQLFFNLNA